MIKEVLMFVFMLLIFFISIACFDGSIIYIIYLFFSIFFLIEYLFNIFNKSIFTLLNLKDDLYCKCINVYKEKKNNFYFIYILISILIFAIPFIYVEAFLSVRFSSFYDYFIKYYLHIYNNLIYLFTPETYINILKSDIIFAGLNYIIPIFVIIFIIFESIGILFLIFAFIWNIKKIAQSFLK